MALGAALGVYDDEGLAVQVESIQSNTKAVQALAGGSADVSTGSFAQVVSLASHGRDVKSFTTIMLGSEQVVVAAPGSSKKIRSIRDLRGTPVGVGGPGGPGHLMMNWLLTRNGLSPSDVTIVSIGTLATAAAAVEHDKVAAAVLNEAEYLILRKRGIDLPTLVDLRGRENMKHVYGREECPTAVLMASGPWLRDHAETARRLARAINRTVQWMHQQSPDTVLKKLPGRYRGDWGIDLAAITTVLPMYSITGAMNTAGAEAVKRIVSVSMGSVRAGRLDLGRAYTNEFLPRL